MFDTHCHLNFSRFSSRVQDVIDEAQKVGVTEIVVPGTDIKTSIKALELAKQYEHVYAAVGIHPHHVYECNVNRVTCNVQDIIKEIESMLSHPKVVAVGEVGLDRHYYQETKYADYTVSQEFIDLQKKLLTVQIKLAIQYKKSLVLHNREAKKEFLEVMTGNWNESLAYKTVFHCCEADQDLLSFAKEHQIFIGVDGDVTYDLKKQEFVKTIPLELLVLETDSPYLLPEPLRSQKKFPNEPKNIPLIAQCISEIKGVSINQLIDTATANAKRLFL
ncbi:TatD family hydrolase [Candidatus Roizmanbacteria bacterium]|nr:TatD family hydrolase [Candidatus Roizmanbacteria bacterium]